MPATATTFETLTVETTDGVCTITMNRPKVYNALNNTLTFELQDALKTAARDQEVRVVVLTGEGKAFCSGQDLGDLKTKYVPGYVPHLGSDLHKRYNPIVKRIRGMDKPVIAAVNGACAGLGFVHALACDLRFAAAGAKFTVAFSRRGLIAEHGSSWTLPRRSGRATSSELWAPWARISRCSHSTGTRR